MEVPYARAGEQHLIVENHLQPTTSRETGPQSYNHKKLKSVNKSDEHKNRLFPKVSRQDSNPADTLILAYEIITDPTQPTQTSDL